MTEEEKAIQFYKRFIEAEEQELEWMYKEDEEYYRDSIEQKELLIKGWRNILNLITKLRQENEELTTALSKQSKDIGNYLVELQQKDKQIDLMAEHIVSSAIVDDTVCAIKCDCESDILEDCSHEKMLNCTKEYFKRKATNIG